jgi:hypothetical protein
VLGESKDAWAGEARPLCPKPTQHLLHTLIAFHTHAHTHTHTHTHTHLRACECAHKDVSSHFSVRSHDSADTPAQPRAVLTQAVGQQGSTLKALSRETGAYLVTTTTDDPRYVRRLFISSYWHFVARFSLFPEQCFCCQWSVLLLSTSVPSLCTCVITFFCRCSSWQPISPLDRTHS